MNALTTKRTIAEAVIGACLLDNNVIPIVKGLLPIGAFDDWPDLKLTYVVINELSSENSPVDFQTVYDRVTTKYQSKVTSARWDPTVIANTTLQILSPGNVQYYAKGLREHYLLKRCSEFFTKTLTAISSGEISDADEAIERIVSFGQKIAEWWTSGLNSSEISDAVKSVIARIEHNEMWEYLPSGFAGLDSITGGLQRGAMIVVGARPSVGKTAIGITMAVKNAVNEMMRKTDGRVVFVSLEMTQQMIVERMMSLIGMVPLQYIVRPHSINGRRNELIEAVSTIGGIIEKFPLDVIESGTGSRIQSLEGAIQAIASKSKISLVVVDYVQLISGTKRDSRVQELSEITRRLKLLALRHNCPVVVLSQLNRNIEHNEKRRMPTLSDLRDSGSIEQDADIVIFPIREQFDEEVYGITEDAMINVAKHRNGPIGHFECKFVRPLASYFDLDSIPEVMKGVEKWLEDKQRVRDAVIDAEAEKNTIDW